MPGGKGRGGGMGRGGQGGGRGSGRGSGMRQGGGRGSGRGGGISESSEMGFGDILRGVSRFFPGEDRMGIQPVGEPVKVADAGTKPKTGGAITTGVSQGEDNLSLRAEVNMLKDDIKVIYKILRKIQEKLDSLTPLDEISEEEKVGEEVKEQVTDL